MMRSPVKDPMCGEMVAPGRGVPAFRDGHDYYVCSAQCRTALLAAAKAPAPPGFDPEVPTDRRIAYFSMEVAVESEVPTYSGGLGVLAGDTLKSCADLRVPVVAVSLVHRKGYFKQILNAEGRQEEAPSSWDPSRYAELLPARVSLTLEGRSVTIQAWRYWLLGSTGFRMPLLYLDTDIPLNSDDDRRLTDQLYGGDDRLRLIQEAILGIGGARILKELGYTSIERYHMNEGHSSLLGIELLRDEHLNGDLEKALSAVRRKCVFTTHTPVPAGHDHFSYELVEQVLGPILPSEQLKSLAGEDDLNMTILALNLSRYVNGVARKHKEVSRNMFPGYDINHITNGVHSYTWTVESFRSLFDMHIPGWATDPAMLRHAVGIPDQEVWDAHHHAKECLLLQMRRRQKEIPSDMFLIGFARRATLYKRADLIFHNLVRLHAIAERHPFGIVFAGKAHPKDTVGKALIQKIHEMSRTSGGPLHVFFLENYDMDLARLIVGGVDLWLNTPQRPLEASGTSGMKAAHNGIPSLSILDGWWIEGCIPGQTGWPVGPSHTPEETEEEVNRADAEDLYMRLETILPLYYGGRQEWINVMKQAIALNASFFNTHRMVQQYVTNAYLT